MAGVLWAFLFAPSIGIVTYALKGQFGIEWNWLLTATRRCCSWSMAAVWNHISYNFVFLRVAGPSRAR